MTRRMFRLIEDEKKVLTAEYAVYDEKGSISERRSIDTDPKVLGPELARLFFPETMEENMKTAPIESQTAEPQNVTTPAAEPESSEKEAGDATKSDDVNLDEPEKAEAVG